MLNDITQQGENDIKVEVSRFDPRVMRILTRSSSPSGRFLRHSLSGVLEDIVFSNVDDLERIVARFLISSGIQRGSQREVIST